MASLSRNDLTISGAKEGVERVMERILVTEDYMKEIEKRNESVGKDYRIDIPEIGKLTFNRLVPTPTNIYQGMLDANKEKNVKDNWYDWNCEHWGTKTDAYDDQIITRAADGVLMIAFKTAWCPPFYYLEKLTQVCLEEGCVMYGYFLIETNEEGVFYIDGNELCVKLIEDL